jgi:hypothetical protein
VNDNGENWQQIWEVSARVFATSAAEHDANAAKIYIPPKPQCNDNQPTPPEGNEGQAA